MSLEFEIKSVATQDQVAAVATEATFIGITNTVDEYLDTPEGVLYKSGVFVRIRDNSRLDVKYNPDVDDLSHTQCIDRGFPLPLRPDDKLEADNLIRSALAGRSTGDDFIFSFNALQRLVVIEKKRTIYEAPGVTIAVDQLSDLGTFVEIEALTDEDASEVARLAQALTLGNLAVGYVELTLRQHRFDLYLQGRYVLAQDR